MQDLLVDGQAGPMDIVHDLLVATDAVFEKLAHGLRRWPDPHENRPPTDDEYSVVTDATKWRIIGARVDAWFEVLEAQEVARIDRDISVEWAAAADVAGMRFSRMDRAVPRVGGALSLVVARSMLGDVDGAGVTVGVGNPTTMVTLIPDCGCDACDHGSQPELDQVDRIITSVVSGRFRRLESGDRTITQLDHDSWSASGSYGRNEVERVLENSTGWNELSGPPWLA